MMGEGRAVMEPESLNEEQLLAVVQQLLLDSDGMPRSMLEQAVAAATAASRTADGQTESDRGEKERTEEEEKESSAEEALLRALDQVDVSCLTSGKEIAARMRERKPVVDHDHAIEEKRSRLSRCKMNEAHKSFFQQWGPHAWHVVPDYMSSNAFTAGCFARLFLAFIRDGILSGKLGKTSRDVYIVEMGAGTGQLAYLLVRQLQLQQEFLPLLDIDGKEEPVRIRYILTDFAEKNVQFWQESEYFKFYTESGMVDFARFDVLNDQELHLRVSKKVLKSGSFENPVMLFGNYLVDSLPNDAFQVVDHTLREVLLSYSIQGNVQDPRYTQRALNKVQWSARDVFPPQLYEDDPDGLFSAADLRAEAERRALEEGESSARPVPKEFRSLYYYKTDVERAERLAASKAAAEADGVPFTDSAIEGPSVPGMDVATVLDEILDHYRVQYESCASFMIPIGGTLMMENLFHLFGERCLMLFGDKGDVDVEEGEGLFWPSVTTHGGAWSFMVNFDALKLFFEKRFSQVHASQPVTVLLPGQNASFKLSVFAGGLSSRQLLLTRQVFEEVKSFGPDNYFRIYNHLVNLRNARLSTVHSLLKLSNNDPSMMFKYKDVLLAKLPKSSTWKSMMVDQLLRVWANYYHHKAAREEDIPYAMGEIFLALDRPEEACRFFFASLNLNGNYVSTNYQIGVCYEKAKHYQLALDYFTACKDAQMDVECAEDIDKHIGYVEKVLAALARKKAAQEKLRQEKAEAAERALQERKRLEEAKREVERSDTASTLTRRGMPQQKSDSKPVGACRPMDRFSRMQQKFSKYSKTEEEEEEEEEEESSSTASDSEDSGSRSADDSERSGEVLSSTDDEGKEGSSTD